MKPANDANEKIIYKELSFVINGLLFKVHNTLGRYSREKQYGDAFDSLLKGGNIAYQREQALPLEVIDNQRTNIVDFVVEGSIALEFKAKSVITKEDYYQVQRYLHASQLKLGMLVNFRSKYLRPIRIIRINS